MSKKQNKGVPYKDPSMVSVDNSVDETVTGKNGNPDYSNPLKTDSFRPTFHNQVDETAYGQRRQTIDALVKNQQQFNQQFPQTDEYGNPLQTVTPPEQQPLQSQPLQPADLNIQPTDYSGTSAGDLLRGVTRTPDVLSGITVNDYAPQQPGGATGDLGAATYFPGAQVQPLQYHGMAGGYFRELPLFVGGKSIYPFGIADARKKAIEDAALKSQLDGQKANNDLWDKYKIPKGKPVYQPAINKYYTDQIYSPMKKIFDDYGYRKAVSILNDPNQPETQAIMQNYVNLEQLAKAQTDMDSTIAKLTDDIKAGRVLAQNISPGTQGLLNKYSQTDMISAFNNGDIKLEDITKLPQLINTYITLDTKTKDLTGFIGQDVDSWYEDGITDNKGNVIRYGDAKFINEVKKKMLAPEKMDAMVQLYMNDPTLTPDVKNPDTIRKYLETTIPTQLEQKLSTLQKPQGNTFNFGDKNAKTYTLNEKGEITMDRDLMDDNGKFIRTENIKNPYSAGVTFAHDDIQVDVPIISLNLKKYNKITKGQEDKYSDSTTSGDIIGVYKFAVDKDGQMTTPGSKHQTGWDWFSGVQVTEDRPVTDFAGAALHKTEQFRKTYFIPADKTSNQIGFLIKDDQVTLNKNVVPKKTTESSEKNYTVPSGTVPDWNKLQPTK